MIRVLHIVNAMNRGGIESFLMNLYRNIDRNIIQFDFLVHTDKKGEYDDEIKNLGGEIYRVSPRNRGIIKNKRELETFFSKHKEYKAVHAHLSSASYITPLIIARRHGIPGRIIHSHNTMEGGNIFHRYIHAIKKNQIKKLTTHNFACSDLAAKWMFTKRMYKKGEYKIINNAIDAEHFIYNAENRKQIRKEFNLNNEYVIGHIGRFVDVKNHDFLVSVFKILHDRDKRYRLMLVGDGKLRTYIEKKVEELNLEKAVFFTGIRADVAELLHGMDIFVFPSIYEGLPVTLIEAQAAGLKCIVSDVITKQVAVTNNIVYMSLNEQAEKWADAIEKESNYKRENQFKQIKKTGFNIQTVAKEIMKVYTSIDEE